MSTSPVDHKQIIQSGEPYPTAIHESLMKETPILEIDKFNLFYGAKQALWDIGMIDLLPQDQLSQHPEEAPLGP